MSSTAGAPAAPAFDPTRQLARIRRVIGRRSFCVLSTSSTRNRPHSVGLLYAAVDLTLYFVVGEDTVKVRNIRQNPHVAVTIPVRRGPFGPPMAVQFQGTAEVLAPDDPDVLAQRAAGRLKRISGLGATEHPGICYLRVRPGRRISSYGIGISIVALLRDLSKGLRSVELPPGSRTT